jgi:hypothetical protein
MCSDVTEIDLFWALCGLGATKQGVKYFYKCVKELLEEETPKKRITEMLSHLVRKKIVCPSDVSEFYLVPEMDFTSLRMCLNIPMPDLRDIVHDSSCNLSALRGYICPDKKFLPQNLVLVLKCFDTLDKINSASPFKSSVAKLKKFFKHCSDLLITCSNKYPMEWKMILDFYAEPKRNNWLFELRPYMRQLEILKLIACVSDKTAIKLLEPTEMKDMRHIGYENPFAKRYHIFVTDSYRYKKTTRKDTEDWFDCMEYILDAQLDEMKMVAPSKKTNCLSVDKNPESNKWSNPFGVGEDKGTAKALELYKHYLENNSQLISDLHELDGYQLMCACSKIQHKYCHGPLLIEMRKKQIKQEFEKQKLRLIFFVQYCGV